MQGINQNQFAQAPSANIDRSTFNRSHGYKTTFDAGPLVPFYVDEALPGDTFNLKLSAFARLATPIKPIMDNMYLETFFFAVPYRLVWENWERFNGAQDDPGDSTDFLIPTMTGPAGSGVVAGTLSDYMGIPTEQASISFNSLHHRAYNLIYNDWFRDENLQSSLVVDKDNGPDTYTDYALKNRGKRHDYFTSCLPFPQKSPNVPLPLAGLAPVTGIGSANQVYAVSAQGVFESDGTNPTYQRHKFIDATSGANTTFYVEEDGATGFPNIQADLSQAVGPNINEFREAIQLQALFERDAQGGTRYPEIIMAHFKVKSADSRLQRPEYLGGGSSPVNIHPVQQTADTAAGTPQGNLAGYGTASVNQSHGFSKSFTEHCLLIGIVNVRADLTYQQGLDRMFSRQTRFDFLQPALTHLGEQEVLNKEILMDGSSNDDDVFGYQERYGEYRFKPSKITGKFRSNATGSLEIWHLSQDYSSLPSLGSVFITEDVPVDRVIAVPSEPQFLLDCYFDLTCARPMPVKSIPASLSRF